MLENCRWFLYISRICGCHPHTINEQSTVTNFRLLSGYSLIVLVVYCVAAYCSSGFATACSKIDLGCVLQRVNRYNRSFYMIPSILFSCLRRAKFEDSLITVHKFDELLKHHRWNIANGKRNKKWKIDCIQWLAIVMISSAWFLRVVLGSLILKELGVKNQAPILISFLIQIITRTTFCFELVKFYLLYDALRRRFQHLNKLCHGLIGTFVRITIGIDINFYANRLTIENFKQLYHCLYDATEYLTSYYSPQLLCWIMFMLLDVVTYIFTVLYGNIQFSSALLVCDECITILLLTLQIVAISRICHLTCNEVLAYVHTLKSRYDACCGNGKTSAVKDNDLTIETIELAIYLRLYPLRIRVYSLFDLDTRFTFSVFGIVLMYVVLIYSYID
ncbi:uncharacterized protein [Cardiocondyla obscurior]|uniref:uncharacterized protein n=1 Tax=Cardiocondyla obscurior TaxID=286306 RepID=UPI0039657231